MGDINTTVLDIVRTVRNDMADVFDLNTSDEFVDLIAAFVTQAMRGDTHTSQAHIAYNARNAAYTALMLAPCTSCGRWVDIDVMTDNICYTCRAHATQPLNPAMIEQEA
jgi:hypothetical protein